MKSGDPNKKLRITDAGNAGFESRTERQEMRPIQRTQATGRRNERNSRVSLVRNAPADISSLNPFSIPGLARRNSSIEPTSSQDPFSQTFISQQPQEINSAPLSLQSIPDLDSALESFMLQETEEDMEQRVDLEEDWIDQAEELEREPVQEGATYNILGIVNDDNVAIEDSHTRLILWTMTRSKPRYQKKLFTTKCCRFCLKRFR